MADTIYRIVYINKLETRSDTKVYSDLDNVIWSLEKEEFKKVNEIENTFSRTEYEDNGKKINTLAVIQEVIHYEGRRMPKEHVYLKTNESDLKMEIVDLLTDIVYEDKLTKEEKEDKKLEVTLKALELKRLLKEER